MVAVAVAGGLVELGAVGLTSVVVLAAVVAEFPGLVSVVVFAVAAEELV